MFKKKSHMEKTALITGCYGQDGIYLTSLLLSKGYRVIGIARSKLNGIKEENIQHKFPNLLSDKKFLVLFGDVCNAGFLRSAVLKYLPDEIYHLAASSDPKATLSLSDFYFTNCTPTFTLVSCLKYLKDKNISLKLFNASSSQIFYGSTATKISENEKIAPISNYGLTKAFSHLAIEKCRHTDGIFAVNGVLFNHESPLRGNSFLFPKICRIVKSYQRKKQQKFFFNNLEIERDWSHANDIVCGIYEIMQLSTPDDFILGSGKATSVRDVIERAFALSDTTLEWRHEAGNLIGMDANTGTDVIFSSNTKNYEPTTFLADTRKIEKAIGWKCALSTSDIMEEMLQYT